MSAPDLAPIDPPAVDLSEPRRVHVVGVGGPGMSAVALTLVGMGHTVTGSDIRERQILDRLRSVGVQVYLGHSREHVVDADVVTYSTAIPADLNELDEARRRGITTVHRSEVLAAICAATHAIGVAGTHGKTTTSSMMMLALTEADRRPGFVIGGDVTDMGVGAAWTGSNDFVIEADESDGTHLRLPLRAAIVTNVDVDHLDHYGSFDAVVDGFRRFLAAVDGPRVVCADDPVAASLAAEAGAITYGENPAADYQIVDAEPDGGAFRFRVEHAGDEIASVRLPLRGRHNVANACGVIALAHLLGVDGAVSAAALARFGGVARRFDVRASDDGATFVDDYAHLPREIDAVLSGARDSGDGWRRVVAVFQPNRYNRMAEMWQDYGAAFGAADLVILTDIYASGTQPLPGVTGKLVVNAVCEADPTRRVVWLPRREDLVRFVADEIGTGDVCISMGCGDIATFPDEVVALRRSLRGH